MTSTNAKANSTTAIHAGALHPRPSGAIGTPIFQASTYEYRGEDYHDIGYMRLSTSPNHQVLARRIAALEGSESALATGSGMAAISATLFTLLSTGDHILVQDCLYGGTTGLLTSELARMGVTHTHIDPQDPPSWPALIRPTTRAIYVETLTNPTVQMADLEAVVPFAKEHGLVSVVDNTFASPVNFRPATLGFDVVLESCTKFMNGHTDIIAGSVAGSKERIASIKKTLDHLGGVLDTHTCFLLERGLKTLPLRIRQHNANAMAVASFLEAHPAVARVNYPGLASHPHHERAARLLAGFGGMLSFEVKGGVEPAERFLSRLTIPAVAVSLGGAESLIVRPAAAVHGDLPPDERARSGISDGLIRFSVGLEDEADLLADVGNALES
ncbi:MAG TPA: aminotransferase class I/II-fold pyridoxal phosphate-dependent enzyme [Longimicrobiales bacterium]|jgi:cystathionine gamma-synthase/cystathionine gamma-lyase/cystathionine beta-lyase